MFSSRSSSISISMMSIEGFMTLLFGLGSLLFLFRVLFGKEKKFIQYWASPVSTSSVVQTSSTSTTTTEDHFIEGMLLKKGSRYKSWRARYFILDAHGKLRYYLSKDQANENVCKDEFYVHQAIPVDNLDRPHAFQLSGLSGQVWLVSADSLEARRQWLEICAKIHLPHPLVLSIQSRHFKNQLTVQAAKHQLDIQILSISPGQVVTTGATGAADTRPSSGVSSHTAVPTSTSSTHSSTSATASASLFPARKRHYYIVLKFKSFTSHDLSQVSVGQTQSIRGSQIFSNFPPESFQWTFQDHECSMCPHCAFTNDDNGSSSVTTTSSLYQYGIPSILVCQLWEDSMFRNKKIASTKIRLSDVFRQSTDVASIQSTWSLCDPKQDEQVELAQIKLEFNYRREQQQTTRMTRRSFLTTESDQREPLTLLHHKTLTGLGSVKDLVERFYLDLSGELDERHDDNDDEEEEEDHHPWKNERTNLQEQYDKTLGDTETRVTRWEDARPELSGFVRTITGRSLTRAPIGPASTLATRVQHLEYFPAPEDRMILSTKVTLHDIPYGDAFTVETEVIATSAASSSSGVGIIHLDVRLAIPFSKGCMWKSKILSNTTAGVTESMDLLFRLMQEAIDRSPGGLPPSSSSVNHNIPPPPLPLSRSSGASSNQAQANVVKARASSSVLDATVAVEEIFENQRFSLLGGWGVGHLLVTDRERFTNRAGAPLPIGFSKPCPENWTWTSNWHIDYKYTVSDEDGWSYASDFPRFQVHLQKGKSSARKLGASVRRRRWIRTLCYLPPSN